MLRNWIMALLSTTLLVMPQGVVSQNPLVVTEQSTERDRVELEGLNDFYYESPKLKEFKEETHRIKIEKEEQERKRKEEELKRQQEEQNKKQGIPVRLLCTYYGSTASQCGNDKGIMANGKPVHYGAIAVPHSIPLGSKIIMDESGREFIASDRGHSKYICDLGENYYRVDIFIPRNNNESTQAYEQRVRAMGTDDVTAMLYID